MQTVSIGKRVAKSIILVFFSKKKWGSIQHVEVSPLLNLCGLPPLSDSSTKRLFWTPLIHTHIHTQLHSPPHHFFANASHPPPPPLRSPRPAPLPHRSSHWFLCTIGPQASKQSSEAAWLVLIRQHWNGNCLSDVTRQRCSPFALL